MSLSILNNISSLTAENALSNTQASLQKTLTQLSTGLRINSGADDAAGLSIANGLQANIAALTQSQLNASNGIGMLQTADGALSQVTSLLNRAVTLAQEAANSTLNGSSGSQATALDTEFQTIMKTINTIGSTTNFNSSAVFSGNALSIAMGDGTSSGNMTVSPTIGSLSTSTIGLGVVKGQNQETATVAVVSAPASDGSESVSIGGTTYTFDSSAGAGKVQVGSTTATATALAAAINGTDGNNTANSEVSAVDNGDGTVTLISLTGAAPVDASSGDGSKVTISSFATSSANASTNDLLTNAHAAAALNLLTTAISNVAAQRGTVGAAINQLQSASNIMNTQVQNLQSADNSVMNADIGKTVADMTQYNVLQSTGMSALQQSNQAQQAVLKLLQ